jgi:hypothetical protein
MAPSVFPTTGGISVIMTIVNAILIEDAMIVVKFGNVVVNGTAVTEDTIECIVPSHLPGSVSVAASINGGKEFYNSDLEGKYVEPYSVLGLIPDKGPMIGRTNVTVMTSGLKKDVSYICMFGQRRQDAFFVNDTTVYFLSHCTIVMVMAILLISICYRKMGYLDLAMLAKHLMAFLL